MRSLRQRRLLLRGARAAVAARLRGRVAPLHTSLMLTRRCNYDCAYCDRWTASDLELDTSSWLSLLEQAARAGCQRVSFTGGEPLLRRDLGALVQRAAELGLWINLNTNGSLVPQRIQALRRVHRVTISLDGGHEVHDATRGPGAFAAVEQAARLLQREGLPLRFYTVLSRRTLADLEAVLAVAEQHGAKVFFQPSTALTLDGSGPNPESPEPEKYRAAVDRLLGWRRQGRPVGNSVPALQRLRSWPVPIPLRCQWQLFCRVEPDGTLRSCGRQVGGSRPNAVDLGLRQALRQLEVPACTACWSAARVELHLLAAGHPKAWWEHLGLGRRGVASNPFRR